jgi:hypothetical protein
MCDVHEGLKKDNETLMNQIAEMSELLAATRSYADRLQISLSEQQQQQVEIDQREAHYRSIIKNLKGKIRQDDSAVPIGLFKQAVARADAKSSELENQKNMITQLKQEVVMLQSKLKDMDSTSSALNIVVAPIATPTPRSKSTGSQRSNTVQAEEGQERRVSFAPVTPVRTNHPHLVVDGTSPLKENETPLSSRQLTPKSQQSSSKAASRASLVRAAGGRKGLVEKLKQARSPVARAPLKIVQS